VLEAETTAEIESIAVERRGVRLAKTLGVHDAGRALGDFVTYLPTKVLPAVAGFLALPLVARKLPSADFGVLAIAQTLVSLGWICAGQWLTSTITRELPTALARDETEAFDQRLRGSLRVTIVLFAGYVAFLGIGALVTAALAHTFLLIAAASLGLIVQNIAVTLFQGSLRPRAYLLVEVGSRVLGLSLAVGLVFAGYGINGFLAGIGSASLVIGAIGLRAAWPGPIRGVAAPWPDVRPWLAYGVPASISAVAVWALLFVDRYLLSVIRTAREVGIYSLGSVLGDRPISLPVLAFTVASRPLLVAAFDGRGRADTERMLASYTRIVVLLTVPVVAYLAACRTALLGLLVGTSQNVRYYHGAANVVPIIALASFFGALALFSNTGLSLARKTPQMVYAAAVGLAVNVAANLVLIPLYGIVGAAIAAPIGMATYVAASQFWSRRVLTWHFPFATLVRAAVAAGAGAGASVAISHAAGWVGFQATRPEIAILGTTALVGGGIYVLVLVLLGERRALRQSSPRTRSPDTSSAPPPRP
jgi:O-antigen/teichoic acid export membrane protein